jgi:thiol-disulfide isomerase/thioredoxin
MHRVIRAALAQLAIAGGLLLGGSSISSAATCPLDLGGSAPRLAGIDLGGNPQELAQYRGRWVFIDFWATWCHPCMLKLPEVVKLQQATAESSELAVLSVSLDEKETEQNVADVVRDFGVEFPILCDGQGWYGTNAREWCVESIPATFLVDPTGRLIARDVEPSQVQQFVQLAGQASYEPIQVLTRERLLGDSPSTGRNSLCDLQVAVDLLPASSRIRRYKLQAYYAFRDGGDGISAQTAGYEIELNGAEPADQVPLSLVITPVEVSFSDREWRATPILAAAIARPRELPALSATVNTASRSCEFTLPLPRQCVSIAYSLCFFDESLGKYICNGIRIMNNPL